MCGSALSMRAAADEHTRVSLAHYLWFIAFVLCLSAGCSPSVSRVRFVEPRNSKPSNCSLDMYAEGESIPRSVTLLGEIDVSDTGLSLNCSADDVLRIIRAEGCALGADAVQLFNVRHPSPRSTCFQASARFYIYKSLPAESSKPPDEVAFGTGFYVSDDLVATNLHVVDGGDVSILLDQDSEFPAKLILRDASNDLAILRMEGRHRPLEMEAPGIAHICPLVDSDAHLVGGEQAVVLGFPLPGILGTEVVVETGLVSSPVGLGDDPRMFQISVPIQPGNSGSPVFNSRGQVIGVATSTLNNVYLFASAGVIPQNVNFAVKACYLRNLLALLPDVALQTTSSSEGVQELSAAQLRATYGSMIVRIQTRRSTR